MHDIRVYVSVLCNNARMRRNAVAKIYGIVPFLSGFIEKKIARLLISFFLPSQKKKEADYMYTYATRPISRAKKINK